MKITYLGTTSLLFDDGTNQVLFDAHVTRPSIFRVMFGKISTDEEMVSDVISRFHMNRLRGIFISHSHYDHVLDVPEFANKCGAVIYGSPSALNVGRGGNVPKDMLVPFCGNQEFCIGKFKIRVLPSIHSKSHFYNNDLGKTIDEPLSQPAKKKDFKEGGSFDFFIENSGKTFLIRPSCNYLKNQLNDINADVLFLGIGGLSKSEKEQRQKFFTETIEKVNPKLVVPIHWDNFFKTLRKPVTGMPHLMENTEASMNYLAKYCAITNRKMIVQIPLSFMEF